MHEPGGCPPEIPAGKWLKVELKESYAKRALEGASGVIVHGFDVCVKGRCVVVCKGVVVCICIPGGDALALTSEECKGVETFSKAAAENMLPSTLPSCATGMVDVHRFIKENISKIQTVRSQVCEEYETKEIKGIIPKKYLSLPPLLRFPSSHFLFLFQASCAVHGK